MKKIFLVLMVLCIILIGCKPNEKVMRFSFGEDLVFKLGENTTIDLEKSSDIVKSKYEKLRLILTEDNLKDVVTITTTTANIFSELGLELTGAADSKMLNEETKKRQYSLENSAIDKSKVLNIGSAIAPNIEAIVQLNPKIVLYSDALPHNDFLKMIEEAKINVSPIGQSDYIDMFILVDVLNHVTDFKNPRIVNKMEELVKSLKKTNEIIKTKSKKNVALLQVSGRGISINNKDSVLGRILDAIGVDNVFSNTTDLQLNLEQLLTTNPEYIVYYAHGRGDNILDNFEAELKNPDGIYRELQAVKNNKFYSLQNDEVTFNASVELNIIKIIEYLATKIYE